MTSKSKALKRLAAAFVLGIVLGSAASVFLVEGPFGLETWLSRFEASLLLSPFLLTLGLLVSLGTKGFAFFLLLCAGGLCAFTSLFLDIQRRFPLPQWLMLGGSFVWSLGNAIALDTMMGV